MHESSLIKRLLILTTVMFLLLLLGIPLFIVFQVALRHGPAKYLQAITHPETLSAIKLTLLTVSIAVPLNIIFGIALAWSVTKFKFPGKTILVSLIDIPFAVSPVISGLIFVLLFGANSSIGSWLMAREMQIIFAVPGIILATTFVTLPFVARELIPVMETHGVNQELAALTLGASPWQMFRLVTFPNIKWGLFYGSILCTARAVGEFGAVSVVSGHIRGKTNTLPLHIEILYNEYHFSAAFAVATLLVALAVTTLVFKSICRKMARRKTIRRTFRHRGSVA